VHIVLDCVYVQATATDHTHIQTNLMTRFAKNEREKRDKIYVQFLQAGRLRSVKLPEAYLRTGTV
jgi:hypothetical protein